MEETFQERFGSIGRHDADHGCGENTLIFNFMDISEDSDVAIRTYFPGWRQLYWAISCYFIEKKIK